MSKLRAILIIAVVSVLVHFAFFGHPNQTVFDEVHFGKFISGYYTHQYFFDIHPPLGKLLIAGFGKVFHFQPEYSFAQIGDKFPDNKYKVLRVLPAVAGSILPIVVFLLAEELGFGLWASLTVGVLTIFENALVVQSRLILMDAFLLVFGFAALLFYLRYYNGKGLKNLIWAGIFGGLSASVKWTGLTFLALPAIAELYRIIIARKWKMLGRPIIWLGIVPFILYFAFFVVHFQLLNKSGPGDAFMSAGFQKTLQGNEHQSDDIKTPNIFQKFVELNVEMYQSNQRLTADHPYGSKWYTWPLLYRPIYYWIDHDFVGPVNSRIYLLGNPIIWWLSTLYVIILLASPKEFRKDRTAWFLLIGYAINFLPFIGIKRVMFLYHYLTGIVFAMMIMVYVIAKLSPKPKPIMIALMCISVATFIFFAPLTYGLPLSEKAYSARVWLNSWR